MADVSSLVRELHISNPDEIYNLGAISFVAYSWDNASLTSEVTGKGVLNILEATRLHAEGSLKQIRFYQASSGEIFGNSSTTPQDEKTWISPTKPYGASKAHAHFLTAAYRAKGLSSSNVILYNHESPRRPETIVSRKITSSVAKIEAGLQDFLTLGDISVKRDWGWAPDYANAISLIAEADPNTDYVVASGVSHTIEEFVSVAFQEIGISDWMKYVKIGPKLFRPNETTELKGNSNKIRSELGWVPTKDFREIVAAMLAADRKIIQMLS